MNRKNEDDDVFNGDDDDGFNSDDNGLNNSNNHDDDEDVAQSTCTFATYTTSTGAARYSNTNT